MSEPNQTVQVVGYSPAELAEREAHAARVALAKMWAQSAPRGLRLRQLERWGIDVVGMRRADRIREKIRAGVRALDARWAIPLVRPRLKAPVAP
jgi:hypothetical protein